MKKVRAESPEHRQERRFQRNLLLGLVALACFTPLGIILPQMFGAEEAWGEWGTVYLEKLIGYVPEGLMGTIHLWKAPIPDYGFSSSAATFTSQLSSYIISGFLGLLLVVSIIVVITRIMRKHER